MRTDLNAFESAFNDYDALIKRHPELVAGRGLRPVVVDRGVREEFATRTGTVLGVVSTNPYFYVVVDLVSKTHDGGSLLFPFVRIVQRQQLEGAAGVAVLATIANDNLGNIGDIVVVEQERHATGTMALEIPRGFGEPGEALEETALRELREETGYIGRSARAIGSVEPDSGIQDGCVTIVAVDAVERIDPERELQEAIAGVILMSPARLARSVAAGACRDSFTLAALAFSLGLKVDD